ncbi:hypothetical protein [Exiguobacterium sp. s160]|uniref:hypothetical protein n=1 Tax=Exiguobacterium sp. s160 TaxID=2751265 RepID=UPI001BE9DE5E|nr:hypothetical protein [Exiguobacterium sp. s160]
MSYKSIQSLLPVKEKAILLDQVEGLNRYLCILPNGELESQFGDIEEFKKQSFAVVGYEDVLGDFVGVDIKSGQLLIVNHETLHVEERLNLTFDEFMKKD